MERHSLATRDELFCGNYEPVVLSQERAEELAALNDALRAELGNSNPNIPAASASKPGMKKKQKMSEPIGGENDPKLFDFRLVSGASQVQSISLQEREIVPLLSHQHTQEDTPEEEEQRTVRSQQVAVDSSWLLQEAGILWPSRKPHKGPIEAEIDPNAGSLPPIFIVEKRLRSPKPHERPPVAGKAQVPKLSLR